MKRKINELPDIDTSKFNIDENGNVIRAERMKTKREVLERFAEKGYCSSIDCRDCAYLELCISDENLTIKGRLQKIGAMAILRMFREKKEPLLKVGTEIKFKNGEVYVIESCINQYQEEFILRNKISMVCFPIDFLIGKTWEVVE